MSTSTDAPFRFYDNRQKYLQFVTTTNEKWRVAERAARELTSLRPEPPALRLFDAGIEETQCRRLRSQRGQLAGGPFCHAPLLVCGGDELEVLLPVVVEPERCIGRGTHIGDPRSILSSLR